MAENNSSAPLKTALPTNVEAFEHFVSDCDGSGIQYDGPSYEQGFLSGKVVGMDAAQAVAAQAAPAAVAVPPSAYVNPAGITASDKPGTVVRKLDSAFHDAVTFKDATPALPATEDSSAGDLAEGQPEPVFGDEEHVSVPRGLLSAACSAIDKKRDGVKVLAELRRYTFGDLAAPQAQPADAPIAYLQESDQHLLHRFIETTEDDESFDIGKDAVKRLANLGVVESYGFGRYGVTMFGYWVHEHYWHQNPSLPLKTNADRDREHRAAMAAAQEGGKAAKEA